MKFIKIVLLALFLTISTSYATENNIGNNPTIEITEAETIKTGNTNATKVSHDNHEKDISMTSSTPKEKFISWVTQFFSAALFSFILCWLFPNFFKKTSEVMMRKNKFKLVFEGMVCGVIALVLFSAGTFILVGIYPAMVAGGLLISLYFLGLPTFSIGVLFHIFKKNKVDYYKLTTWKKLSSLFTVNFISLMIVLPLSIYVPPFHMKIEGNNINLDLAAAVVMLALSLIGMGAVVVHAKELIIKNKDKF